MPLTKDEIFARRPTVIQPVEMPEWGGTFYVREMSADERDDYEAGRYESNKTDGKPLKNFRASLVAACAVDSEGTRLFTEAEGDSLGQVPASEIRRMYDAAAKLNGMTDESAKDITKNS